MKLRIKKLLSFFKPFLSDQIFSHRNIKLSLMDNKTWVLYTRGVSGSNLVLPFSTTCAHKALFFLWVFLWKKPTDSAWLSGSSLSNIIPKPLSAMNHISSLEECWTKCSCFSLKKGFSVQLSCSHYPFSADTLSDWYVVLITNHFRGNQYRQPGAYSLFFTSLNHWWRVRTS